MKSCEECVKSYTPEHTNFHLLYFRFLGGKQHKERFYHAFAQKNVKGKADKCNTPWHVHVSKKMGVGKDVAKPLLSHLTPGWRGEGSHFKDFRIEDKDLCWHIAVVLFSSVCRHVEDTEVQRCSAYSWTRNLLPKKLIDWRILGVFLQLATFWSSILPTVTKL